MTLKELSQLYYLSREIEMDHNRLEKMKASASGSFSPNITGIASGGNCDNRIERLDAEIVELEGIISEKIIKCMHERNRLERYIADIPDSLTRQIFTMRFLQGWPWIKIAFSVGGGNTDDSVKKTCYRYLNKSEQT